MPVRSKEQLSECVFRLHVASVVAVIFCGLWLPFWMVVAVLVIHRLQFMYFRGCLLSKIQHSLKPFPDGMGFLEFAWLRFTGIRIDSRQGKALDKVIICASLVIALFV